MSYARRSRFAGRSNESRSILGGVSAAFQTVNSATRVAADKAIAAAVTQDLDDELDLSFSAPESGPSKLPVRKFGSKTLSVNAASGANADAGVKPTRGKRGTKKAKSSVPTKAADLSKTKSTKAVRSATSSRRKSSGSAASAANCDVDAPVPVATAASPSGASDAQHDVPFLLSPAVSSSAASKRDSTGSVLSVASFLSCGSVGQLVTQEEHSSPLAHTSGTPQAHTARGSAASSSSSSSSCATASGGSVSPVDILTAAAGSMADSRRSTARSRMSILRNAAPTSQVGASAGNAHPPQARPRNSNAGGGSRASLSSSALRRLSVGMTAHVQRASMHGPFAGTSGGASKRVSVGALPPPPAGSAGGDPRFPPPMPGAIALPGMAAAAAAAAARRHSALPARAAAVGASGPAPKPGAGFVGRIARRLSVGTSMHVPGGAASRSSFGGGAARRVSALPPPSAHHAPLIEEEANESDEDDDEDDATSATGRMGESAPHEQKPTANSGEGAGAGVGGVDEDEEGGSDAATQGRDAEVAGVNWMLLDAHMSLVMGSVFEWVGDAQLLGAVGAVCHEWRRLATDAYSWRAADVAVLPQDSERGIEVQDEDGHMVRFSLGAQLLSPWAGYVSAFPWARFLAEGGFKKVYGVYFAPAGRLEAVSIMDMAGVVSTGQAEMVRAEVLTGCMVSQLARTGVTPGFVETYQVISVAHAPPPQLWGSPDHKTPQGKFSAAKVSGAPDAPPKRSKKSKKAPKLPKSPGAPGAYQLVRMELCRGGDVEEHLRGVEAAVAAVYSSGDEGAVQAAAQHDALAISQSMFGVLQALCAAADRINMRHYDLKLLNILLKPAADVAAEAAPSAAELVHRFSTPHGRVAQLHMPCEAAPEALSPCQLECVVPKLVDFGTADMEMDTLGAPVTLDHFTTFENVAPEMYWAGDDAQQGYALDVWSVGLCLLHMLTGAMPYEEVMEDVTCPAPLRDALHAVWAGKHWAASARPARGKKGRRYAPSPSFSVLRSCLEFDEGGVMPDTLWRAVVLCGLPAATDSWDAPDTNPVWLLLRGYCGDTSVLQTEAAQDFLPKGSAKNSTLPKPRRTRGRPRKCPQPEPMSMDDRLEALFPGSAESSARFKSARESFSLEHGSQPLMARARARMDALPALRELLLQLLQWDPNERISYTQALSSEAFTWMQEPRTRRAHKSAAKVPLRMRPVQHTQLMTSAEVGDILVEDYTALAW